MVPAFERKFRRSSDEGGGTDGPASSGTCHRRRRRDAAVARACLGGDDARIGGFDSGPTVCPGGSIIYAQSNLESLDAAVIAGKYAKKTYALDAEDSWDSCYNNDQFGDPAPGQPKGCWCVPTDFEPVHPPPSPHPPPRPPHPFPPPGDHPAFASRADLQAAVQLFVGRRRLRQGTAQARR